MHALKKYFFTVFFCFFPIFWSQNGLPEYLEIPTPWADSVLLNTPLKDLIGQVFMPAVYPKQQDSAKILSYIEKYQLGGIMFMQTTPQLLVDNYNTYQKATKIPLLSAMDAEWGLAMRVDSVLAYPRAMTLGAVDNVQLIESMTQNMAQQFLRTGIHLNFAPVTDINTNPQNPVINYRSFGEEAQKVTKYALAYHQGLAKKGILSCIKHFPGHGSVAVDSHHAVPFLLQSKEELAQTELIPFRQLIQEGVGCVMVGHLQVNAIDPQKVASLSAKVIQNTLQKELGYQGVVFSDALNMGAVKNIYSQKGELGWQAFLAGNDILVYVEDVPQTYARFKEALESGEIEEKAFLQRVHKILKLKEWLKINENQPINSENLAADLQKNEPIVRQVLENAFTLLKNEDKIFPFSRTETPIIIVWGAAENTIFENTFKKLTPAARFVFLSSLPNENEIQNALNSIGKNSTVLLSFQNMTQQSAKNYNLQPLVIDRFLSLLAKKTKKIALNVLGNPYSLNLLKNAYLAKAILVGYENTKITQELSAQVIAGAVSPKGKLPVSLDNFDINAGVSYAPIQLGYGLPEEVGLQSEILQKIDSVVDNAILAKAFPGCKILVIKDNKLVWDKNYGYFTYAEQTPVGDSTIYDLASITKMVASTLALMQLESEKKINIDAPLQKYLPTLLGSNYGKIKINDILSHQAGLAPWIPFYRTTVPNPPPIALDSLNENSALDSAELAQKSNFYEKKANKEYSIQVAEDLHLKKEYLDSIFTKIINTPLKNKQQYLYSDLGFYFIPNLVEKMTKQKFKDYIESKYRVLGLEQIGFLPLTWADKSNIPPTEIDNYFRHQTVQGYVHDQGAALLGGVSGHAGIFGSAYDVAALMQLFLNKGTYNGVQLFNESLMPKYNKSVSPKNHRGLGFDKLREGKDQIASNKASFESFGHSGFTGVFAWADPAYNLIFVFLSNRTYPSSDNKLISKLNVRTEIHHLIYDALAL